MKQTYRIVDDFPSPDPEYPAADGWRVQRFQEEGEAERTSAWFYRRPDGGRAEKPLPEQLRTDAGALGVNVVTLDLRDQIEDGPNAVTF